MIFPSPMSDAGSHRHLPGRRRPESRHPVTSRSMTFRFRPLVEILENRALLSTFPVNDMAGGGPGSLHQAIRDSNAATRTTSLIDFALDRGPGRLVAVDVTPQSILQGSQPSTPVSPGAVKLADLNRDGIPDLIVADTGSNKVLIYGGLGRGQVGPPIGGGDGFPANTNPVGITVADLTGDGLPEIVIANKGSNDVLILLNQSQGDSLSFTTGSRLPAGSGPVSTVVSDFNGDGIPDILVNHSGSNEVVVFLGVGGGVFDDQTPVVFSVGGQPSPISADKLGGQPDLAAIDPEANNLTRVADFPGPDPMTSASPPDGVDPVTVFASLREGMLAVYDGGPKGLSLMPTETGLVDPTALAFSALTGGQVQFYTAPAAGELAEMAALGLGVNMALPRTTPESSNTTAQLVPLHESSLALVATVLAFSPEAHGNELRVDPGKTDVTTGAAFLPDGNVSVGQHLSQRGHEAGAERASGEQPGDSTEAVANPGRASAMTWERFVIGLDEALEGFRREYQGPISGDHDLSPRNDREVSQPQAGSSSPVEPTGERSTLGPFPGDLERDGNGSETPTRDDRAIEPTEASLPLVIAAMITGWKFLVRSSVPQPHFSAESSKKRLHRSGRRAKK
jgi:FG-GAP-like repeat